jgi:hypothetical protein
MGLMDSGCVTSRGISAGRKNIERVLSYKEWTTTSSGSDASESSGVLSKSSRRNTMIEDYSRALRPMITLYAVLDQLSREFIAGSSDEITDEASEHLAAKLDSCYKSSDIHKLLRAERSMWEMMSFANVSRRVPRVVEEGRCPRFTERL